MSTHSVHSSPGTAPVEPGLSTPEARLRAGLKQCIVCGEQYYLVPGLAEDICAICETWLDETAPQTLAEQQVESFLQSLDEQGLEDVGLGPYFADLHRPPPLASAGLGHQPPPSSVGSTAVTKRKRDDMEHPHSAQLKALHSQLAYEASKKRQRTSPQSYTATVPVPPSRTLIPAVELSQAPAPSLGTYSGNDVQDFALQSQLALDGKHNGKIYSKHRRPRIICVDCKKDRPAAKENDSLRCTRCYKKNLKQMEKHGQKHDVEQEHGSSSAVESLLAQSHANFQQLEPFLEDEVNHASPYFSQSACTPQETWLHPQPQGFATSQAEHPGLQHFESETALQTASMYDHPQAFPTNHAASECFHHLPYASTLQASQMFPANDAGNATASHSRSSIAYQAAEMYRRQQKRQTPAGTTLHAPRVISSQHTPNSRRPAPRPELQPNPPLRYQPPVLQHDEVSTINPAVLQAQSLHGNTQGPPSVTPDLMQSTMATPRSIVNDGTVFDADTEFTMQDNI